MARLQGHSEQTIEASPARIWAVLEDPSRLPDWVPVVERVTEHEACERTGSLRRCEVAMGARRGYIVERCLATVSEQRLSHAVEDDSLGFTEMFRDYSFTLELEPITDNSTLVTCETFYEPRGTVARMVNAVLMRRRFASGRAGLLRGLRQVVEAPASRSVPAAPETPGAAAAAAAS